MNTTNGEDFLSKEARNLKNCHNFVGQHHKYIMSRFTYFIMMQNDMKTKYYETL